MPHKPKRPSWPAPIHFVVVVVVAYSGPLRLLGRVILTVCFVVWLLLLNKHREQ